MRQRSTPTDSHPRGAGAGAHAPSMHDPGPARDLIEHLLAGVRSIRELKNQLEAHEALLFETAANVAETEASRCTTASEQDLAFRSLYAEFGAALKVTDRTVERHVAQAHELRSAYPAVYASLREGRIDRARTTVICDAGRIIDDPGARRQYERRVLDFAERETLNRLRPYAARVAEQYAAQTIDERHEAAMRERRVRIRSRADGMSSLTATLATEAAQHIQAVLTEQAHAVRAITYVAAEAAAEHGDAPADAGDAPRERRTIEQLKVDVLADKLLRDDDEPPADAAPPRAVINVTVPVTALVSADDAWRAAADRDAEAEAETDAERLVDALRRAGIDLDPHAEYRHLHGGSGAAALDDGGAISTPGVRWLAGHADHWNIHRIDAASGAFISVDRYTPSAAMRRLLAARDQHCRFPGCRVPAANCDLDHTVPYAQGGPTSTANLGHLCRWHHTLKHHSRWQCTQRPGGVYEWISPTGRVYSERPPSRVFFAPAAAGPPPRADEHPF